VVKVRDDSEKGGESIKSTSSTITSSTGMMTERWDIIVILRSRRRCETRPGGSRGQLIAHSGTLVFQADRTFIFSVQNKEGKDRMSIPVKFKTAERGGSYLEEGRPLSGGECGNGRCDRARMNSAANTPELHRSVITIPQTDRAAPWQPRAKNLVLRTLRSAASRRRISLVEVLDPAPVVVPLACSAALAGRLSWSSCWNCCCSDNWLKTELTCRSMSHKYRSSRLPRLQPASASAAPSIRIAFFISNFLWFWLCFSPFPCPLVSVAPVKLAAC